MELIKKDLQHTDSQAKLELTSYRIVMPKPYIPKDPIAPFQQRYLLDCLPKGAAIL